MNTHNSIIILYVSRCRSTSSRPSRLFTTMGWILPQHGNDKRSRSYRNEGKLFRKVKGCSYKQSLSIKLIRLVHHWYVLLYLHLRIEEHQLSLLQLLPQLPQLMEQQRRMELVEGPIIQLSGLNITDRLESTKKLKQLKHKLNKRYSTPATWGKIKSSPLLNWKASKFSPYI